MNVLRINSVLVSSNSKDSGISTTSSIKKFNRDRYFTFNLCFEMYKLISKMGTKENIF